MGISAARIKQALNGFCAETLPGGLYRVSKVNDDMPLILDALGIKVNLRIPSLTEIRKLKYLIDKVVL
jgi:hypothetical protein